MIIVDANVLLYAVNEDAPHHLSSKRWIEEALSGDEPVGFSWIVLLAFIRISTLSAFSPNRLEADEAVSLVDDWLAAPCATTIEPPHRHSAVLRGLLNESGTAGNLVNDAHLAALGIEYGARLCTFDRDFSRFRGVRWFTPEEAGRDKA